MDQPLVLSGATVPWNQVSARLVHSVLDAYNRTIYQTFYLGVAMFALSVLGANSLEWKSIRAQKNSEDATNPNTSGNSMEKKKAQK